MKIARISDISDRELRNPAIAPYHQMSESKENEPLIIAMPKVDKMSIENNKPIFLAFTNLAIKKNNNRLKDTKKRKNKDPAVVPIQNISEFV
jgi:hypothetical protein